ncbi:uncharacterized protein LOC129712172 isoform X2 [Leucoraja erinacea]|uniref:uncharacterized protein LOC129712172 isoform X2 n=1 Tax=Leucoraja erinaceus TaxID=7782 RepID=UPI0024537EFF|nr:uncharacterized protein LOC129712172 isoform X2 [Leucoraja erinacea]
MDRPINLQGWTETENATTNLPPTSAAVEIIINELPTSSVTTSATVTSFASIRSLSPNTTKSVAVTDRKYRSDKPVPRMNKDLTEDCDCSFMVTEGNERAVVAVLGLLSLLCIITTVAGIVLLLYPRLLHNCLQKLFCSSVPIDDTMYSDTDGVTDFCHIYSSGPPDEYPFEEKDNGDTSTAMHRPGSDEQTWPDQEYYRQRHNIDNRKENRSQSPSRNSRTFEPSDTSIKMSPRNSRTFEPLDTSSNVHVSRPFTPGPPEEGLFGGQNIDSNGLPMCRDVLSPSQFPNRIWLDQDNCRQSYVIDTNTQDDRSPTTQSPILRLPPSSSPMSIKRELSPLHDTVLRKPSPLMLDKNMKESPSTDMMRASPSRRSPTYGFSSDVPVLPFSTSCLSASSRICANYHPLQKLHLEGPEYYPDAARSRNFQGERSRNYQPVERSRTDNQFNPQRSFQSARISSLGTHILICPFCTVLCECCILEDVSSGEESSHYEEDETGDSWWADNETDERSSHHILPSDIHTPPGQSNLNLSRRMSGDTTGIGSSLSLIDHGLQSDYSNRIQNELQPISAMQVPSQHQSDYSNIRRRDAPSLSAPSQIQSDYRRKDSLPLSEMQAPSQHQSDYSSIRRRDSLPLSEIKAPSQIQSDYRRKDSLPLSEMLAPSQLQSDYSSRRQQQSQPLSEFQAPSQHQGDYPSIRLRDSLPPSEIKAPSEFQSDYSRRKDFLPLSASSPSPSGRERKSSLKSVPELSTSHISEMVTAPEEFEETYVEESVDEFFTARSFNDLSLN